MFENRHNGPNKEDLSKMLQVIGVDSLDSLIDNTVPKTIRKKKPLDLPKSMDETDYLTHLRKIGGKNRLFKSYIGQGYYGVKPLSVIIRNVLENPAWYTSYTPYQAEISQGRLEALLNYQTMISDLTSMDIANASLLDEATAGAEAMIMMFNARSRAAVKEGVNKLFVDSDIFPQTKRVISTRARFLGIELVFGNFAEQVIDSSFFGAIVQYPSASGEIKDYKDFVDKVHAAGALVAVSADLLSLTLLTPPGEWNADIVFGSTQRFGLPMAYGGPHVGYFATRDALKRSMPGRVIGVSIDAQGNRALRLALQTREQHIKREKATSNICTAQALLAVMSGMYAQYHGPKGLKEIASSIYSKSVALNTLLQKLGYKQSNAIFFDTLNVIVPEGISSDDIRYIAEENEINFYYPDYKTVRLSLDEATSLDDMKAIVEVFAKAVGKEVPELGNDIPDAAVNGKYSRKSDFLNNDVFCKYHSETAMMRYIKALELKDFSLANGMIPLGSCTMKLNSATSMFAMSWPEFANIHPFVPTWQAEGYKVLMDELSNALKEITGFVACSFQPNSGAAGEYAGLLVLREYHARRDDLERNVILIPASAHGTNPASAAMAGLQVVVVACDDKGNISLDDLKEKAAMYSKNLAGIMITYPSTHGVYESAVKDIVKIIHENGGIVYMDGANMNAQVGLTSPANIGADICHLNLHKTFGMPHGGGGPGVGAILSNETLAEFMPTHPLVKTGGANGITAVSAAPFGSAQLLTIAHAYVSLLGPNGLTNASKYAILNANYISAALKDYYKTLYVGENGYVAHELILDCREFKTLAGITEADIAKRLMDYGFHAPTLSFPVHGTLMVEPTESESLEELDRFIDAMKSIYNEIMEVAEGKADKDDNVMKNSPHTALVVSSDEWNHKYSRQKAAYPCDSLRGNKFWPTVSRVDDGFGDRNLVTRCYQKNS